MGSTAIFGIPYPENTDPVTEGADAMQAMAEATDAALTKCLGYAQVVASQSTITTVVDLTGLTVTTPALPAGRRIRVKASLSLSTTVAGGLPRARILEGATQLAERSVNGNTTNALSLEVEAILTPTAGAHTYKVTALLAAGTGSMSSVASATAPAFLIVEDLGPV